MVKVLDFGLAAVRADLPDPAQSSEFADAHHLADPRRDDPGHGGLHESGAGSRQAGGQARRHLGVRRGAVRDADGQAVVRRRDDFRHAGGSCSPRNRIGSKFRRKCGGCWKRACKKIPSSGCKPSAIGDCYLRTRSHKEVLPHGHAWVGMAAAALVLAIDCAGRGSRLVARDAAGGVIR